MRTIIFIIIAAIMLTACSIENHCPSYGNTNHMTKHGSKAQARYIKKRI